MVLSPCESFRALLETVTARFSRILIGRVQFSTHALSSWAVLLSLCLCLRWPEALLLVLFSGLSMGQKHDMAAWLTLQESAKEEEETVKGWKEEA